MHKRGNPYRHPQAAIVMDINGTITWSNASTQAVLGYRPEELVGKNVSMLMPGPIARNHDGYVKKFLRRGDSHVVNMAPRPLTGLHKNGHPVSVVVAVTEAPPEGEARRFMGVVRRVEENPYEADLLASHSSDLASVEDRSARIYLDSSLDAIFHLQPIFDEQNDIVDFEFVDANERAVELTTYTRSELIGGALLKLMPENGESGLFERYKTVYMSGDPYEDDLLVPISEVEATWVHHKIFPVENSLIFHTRDITAQKEAEQRALASEQQLSQIISNMNIMVWEVDNEGTITFSAGGIDNASAPTNQYLGKNMLEIVGNPEANRRNFDRVLSGESMRLVHEFPNSVIQSIFSPNPPDSSGKILGATGIFYEITEEFRSAEKLRHAQKLNTVGQLAGGISHDFNNLIGVILNNLELLETSGRLSEEEYTHIAYALDAAHRGRSLVRRLMTLGKQHEIKLSLVEVNSTILSMLDLIERTLPENISVKTDIADENWNARIDQSQLEGAILNLVINARDAMATGGKLHISTTRMQLAEENNAGDGLSPGDYILIHVSDSGTGISSDEKEKILEPFYTTKASIGGTGLGLSMVSDFVKHANGRLNIEDSSFGGARFTITLPFAKGSEKSKRHEPDEEFLPGNSENVLIVEDDQMLRLTVQAMTKKLGYRSVAVRNAEEAKRALQSDERFDLLFSDVMLPGISGPELLDWARQHYPDMKFLLTSGHIAESIPETLVDDVAFLKKPYELRLLGRTLSRIFSNSERTPRLSAAESE